MTVVVNRKSLHQHVEKIQSKVCDLGGHVSITAEDLIKDFTRRKVASAANVEVAEAILDSVSLPTHGNPWRRHDRPNLPRLYVCASALPNSTYRDHVAHRAEYARSSGHPVTVRWVGVPFGKDLYRPYWASWGQYALSQIGWRIAPPLADVSDLDRAFYAPLPPAAKP